MHIALFVVVIQGYIDLLRVGDAADLTAGAIVSAVVIDVSFDDRGRLVAGFVSVATEI